MNASTNRLKIVKNGGLCLNSRLYVTVAASKMWHQWERSHTFSRYSVYVQRFCRFLKKSKFCCSCIAGKKKKALFIELYVEIRERKQNSSYHETFLSSLKKTNNNKNVALSKFLSSCEYMILHQKSLRICSR